MTRFYVIALGSLLLAAPAAAQLNAPIAPTRSALPTLQVNANALPAFATAPGSIDAMYGQPAATPSEELFVQSIQTGDGRWKYRLIGAAIGAGSLFLALSVIDCSDCDSAAVPAAIGGGVAGFLIGDFAWRIRRADRQPRN
jgi:hypothetical protein